MKRFLKSGLVAAAAVGLMAGAASAGTTKVNHGAGTTTFKIAQEALGAARNITLASGVGAGEVTAANNAAVSYTLTNTLTSSNLLSVTLEGLVFDGSQVNIGAMNTATNGIILGTGTPAAGSTSYNFQLEVPAAANVAAGNFIYLTNADNAAMHGATAAAGNLGIRVAAATATGNKTIAIKAITSGGIEVDPISTANAVNVTREFTATPTNTAMTIDYLGTASNTGMRFLNVGGMNTVAANDVAVNFELAVVNFTTSPIAGANANLTTSAVVNLDASNIWSGVSRVFLANVDCNTAGNNSNIVSSPTGAVALNVDAAAFNGIVARTLNLCVEVDGTTELAPRSITGNIDINVSSGGNDPAAVSGTFSTWTSNGYQAYVPHMRWNSDNTAATYVRFVNRENRAADAQVTLQEDGVATVTADLGTIPARGIVTYNAKDIAQANGITSTNYGALFTVKTGSDSVYGEAFFNLLGSGTRSATLYEASTGKSLDLK